MLYTINKTGGKAVKTPITAHTVFTRCLLCGKEIPVNISLFWGDKNFNVFDPGMLCLDCVDPEEEDRDVLGDDPVGRRRAFRANVTLDGLKLLAETLIVGGYKEIVEELCDEYNVEVLDELSPQQYISFAMGLQRVAAGGRDEGDAL